MNPQALDRSTFERIEAYLMGAMPRMDREAFELQMLADPAFREEVDVQRENMLAIELGAFTNATIIVGTTYQRQHPHIDPGGRVHRGNWTIVLGRAASIAILIGLVWWSMRPPLHERVYMRYHHTDPGLPVPMSATDEFVFHDAMVAYKMGEYAEAKAKWSTLLQADPANDTLRFFIASAALELNEPATAIRMLVPVSTDPSSGFHHKARWSLFLAYVREGSMQEAHAMKMENDPIYGDRVRTILTRMK